MLTWLLELSGFVGTHTSGDGVITDPDAATIPVGAHRWVFTKRDAINAQTAQLRLNHRDENVLLTGNGYAVSQLDLNAAGALTAALLGLYVSRAAADTTTVPAYESFAIPPLRQGELYLNWLAGGGIPADFSLKITNPLEGVNDLSQATTSFFPQAMEFGDKQAAVTGSIPKRVLAAADFDALLALTTFSATARWKSSKVIGGDRLQVRDVGADARLPVRRRRRGPARERAPDRVELQLLRRLGRRLRLRREDHARQRHHLDLRVTMEDADQKVPVAATPASEWKVEESELQTLPSGNVVRLKRPQLSGMIRRGEIPNPLLQAAGRWMPARCPTTWRRRSS
jgi:hypothetical protein